ncbi:hypothetical protein [Hoeflea sp.]|uniref:hypothetical protein n=1 Tax=Hoeflea sp. TaxID=1940281 RepID=UPI001991C1C3|nr:hypothetical protein [Hoeflea sp.]MBC7286374.1 hypothetical protein [Hoeflea sp.]
MESGDKPPLGEQVGIRVAAVSLKGALGAVPLIGSLLAEIAGQFIPQQRVERIEDFMRYLDARIDGLDAEALRERLADPERLDLFEEGVVQSTRALSTSRREYIASIVGNGIGGDDKAKIEAKRMLKLLREVDDDQIIILASKLMRHQRDRAFQERHSAVFDLPRVHMQAGREEFDKAALYELARVELVRLGLLAPRFKTPKKGELPDFDPKTGMMQQTSRDITPLGRMLLRHVGLAGADEI